MKSIFNTSVRLAAKIAAIALAVSFMSGMVAPVGARAAGVSTSPSDATLQSLTVTDASGASLALHSNDSSKSSFTPNLISYTTDPSSDPFNLSVDIVATASNPGSRIFFNNTWVTSGQPYHVVSNFSFIYPAIKIIAPDGTTKNYYLYIPRYNNIGSVKAGGTVSTYLHFLNTSNQVETISNVSIDDGSQFRFSNGNSRDCLSQPALVLAVGEGCYVKATFAPTGNSASSNPHAMMTMTATAASGATYYSYLGLSGITIKYVPPATPDQLIYYPSELTLTAANPVLPPATTTGDGTISYRIAADGTTGCSIDAVTGALTASQDGDCIVEIDASATPNFNEASMQTVVHVVTSQQPIQVLMPTEIFSNEATTFSLAGSVSGQYTVSTDGSTAGACTVTNNEVIPVGSGECDFMVSAPNVGLWAPTNYAAVINIVKANATITWNPSNLAAVLPTTTLTPSELAVTDNVLSLIHI